MFNGFLVPSSGRIKKIILLDTAMKFFYNEANLNDYVDKIGVDKPIQFFTLVLIKQNQTPVDIGTLFFFFQKNSDNYVANAFTKIGIDYVFKYKDPLNDVFVEQKDIINIRTEFNTIPLTERKTTMEAGNYNLGFLDDEFFTYLATVLIELDPLED